MRNANDQQRCLKKTWKCKTWKNLRPHNLEKEEEEGEKMYIYKN